ncbi:MAG: hypothetical protein AAF614_15240 [Chloroflexota bacterium]
MKFRWFVFCCFVVVLAACSQGENTISIAAVEQTIAAQPPLVEVVEQTVVAEVPVTVEVTREVEVVTEVEVTREVEVEVVVEVTQIVEVEKVVTATPTPTLEPTATPLPTNTPIPQAQEESQPAAAAPATGEAAIIDAIANMKFHLDSYGWIIDRALREGFLSCVEVVNTYDAVAFAPTFDVSGERAEVVNGYNLYRSSIDSFTQGAASMTQNCRDFLANPSGGGIPREQWANARTAVNTASDILQPALNSLGIG